MRYRPVKMDDASAFQYKFSPAGYKIIPPAFYVPVIGLFIIYFFYVNHFFSSFHSVSFGPTLLEIDFGTRLIIIIIA